MNHSASPPNSIQRLDDDPNKFRETFLRDGFLGPLTSGATPQAIDRIATRLGCLLRDRERHPLYGRFSVRDWHLVEPEILRLFQDPNLVNPLLSLLGPDLILWRSKVFHKGPGEGELGWHQEWGAFNGEEIGNDRPSLAPDPDASHDFWNLTIWVALVDVEPNMGPIRFARGTHRRRFPIRMEPMPGSEFWHDPFLGIQDPGVIVRRASEQSLVLDIDTSGIFQGMDTGRLTLQEAKSMVMSALSNQVGAVTLDFNPADFEIVDLPMKKGQFVIFTERTMHGSSANTSDRNRLAINARITRGDTLVYPGRLSGDWLDGSNLDIRNHKCVLLAGRDRTGKNRVADQS